MSTAVRVPSSPPSEASEAKPYQWRLGTKIAFRFFFIYFLLFTSDVPIQFVPIPFLQQIAGRYFAWLQLTSRWVGENLLGMRQYFSHFVVNPPGGSHDQAVAWVESVVYIGVAVVGTLVWSWLDRKRPNYTTLYNWFFFYLRMILGIMMINYGSVKVVPAQFAPPALSRLLERFGDASPMGMLWTSMGASQTYSFFAGSVEVMGGILMFVPRLATLGALLSLASLGNVFMLNVGYDVPVKLGILNWIVMALFLLAPDAKRLIEFFVLNRRTEAADSRPLFQRRSWQVAAVALQIAFGLIFLGYRMHRSGQIVEQIQHDRLSAPLYGIWAVDEFVADRQAAPAAADTWRRMTIDSVHAGLIEEASGLDRRVAVQFQPGSRILKLTMPDDPRWRANLMYDDSARPVLLLRGTVDGSPIRAKLHREDETRFPLLSQPFRWIAETANNH
jgi:hypothetical protein